MQEKMWNLLQEGSWSWPLKISEMRILRHSVWQRQQHRQWNVWECRSPRSFFPRQLHTWPVHPRAILQ
jgi:MgsA AAA+ ATPase C terminal